MGIKVEKKTRIIEYEDIVGASCDFCGKEISCAGHNEGPNSCIDFYKW